MDEIGEDNITYESDYPHSDSTWPRTKEIAEEQMADLTDEQRRKIVRGNAIGCSVSTLAPRPAPGPPRSTGGHVDLRYSGGRGASAPSCAVAGRRRPARAKPPRPTTGRPGAAYDTAWQGLLFEAG